MKSLVAEQLRILTDASNHLRSDGRGKKMAVISGFTFLYVGVQMVFPLLLPHLRASFTLTLTSAGLLLSVLWFVKALSQLPGGVVADHLGEGRTLVLSAVLGAGSLFAIVTTDIQAVLFVATGLFGVGGALQAMGRYTALAGIYPERIGLATGVSLASADAGQSLLPPLAGVITVWATWKWGFGFVIPLLVLMAPLLWVYLPTRTQRESGTGETLAWSQAPNVVASLRTRPVIVGSLILTVYLSLWVAFSSFYPTYMVESKGVSPAMTSILFGLFFAIGVVVKPLAGLAFDRFSFQRTFMIIGCVSGGALMAFPLVDGLPLLFGVTILVAPVLGSGTVSMSLLLDELPEDVQGTGFGLIRTITLTIVSGSPVLFGAIADRGFFDEGFVLLGVLALMMIPLSALAAVE